MPERTYRHIVLAYSGGLDTSTALHYLKATFRCRVTAYCANVGQREDWPRLRERALAAGADEFVAEDLRDHFIRDFVFPALHGNAAYETNYLLGTPLARPVIVEGLIRYAQSVGADAISHGCTHKGNDQIRFELAATALDPDIGIVAPWRIWALRSREDCLAYCERNGVPVIHSKTDLFSHDENLIHLTTEGSYLEDIANPFEWNDAGWLTSPELAPEHGVRVTVSFERGDPVAVDGTPLEPVDLVLRLNALGAAHGIGLQDIIENRVNGLKVRGVFENPGLHILQTAHRRLENATLSREVQRVRDILVPVYGEIVYRGLWFSDERRVIQAAFDESQRFVTGHVLLSLQRGTCIAQAVASEASLYARDLVTLHEGREFSPAHAEGFVRTLAMNYRDEARRSAKPPGATPIPAAWSAER